jgi:periplasmic protein TonB
MISTKQERRVVGASVGLSLLGHAAGLAALIWLVAQLPPAPMQIKVPERTVEVVFEPPRAKPPVSQPVPQPAAQPTQPTMPESPPAEIAVEPEPPSIPVLEAQPPSVSAVEAEPSPVPTVEAPLPQPRLPEPPPIVRPKPPPSPPKPVAKKPLPSPKSTGQKSTQLPSEPGLTQQPAPARVQQMPAPPPARPALPAPVYPSQQTAALPLPHPAPPPAPALAVSGAYRGTLSAWLESHKRYPEGARLRGEQGRVGLSFRVARSGQVLSFSLTSSSGYAELDAAVETMMRGATLPPFPPDMTANDVQVTVAIHFGLAR